MKDRDIYNSYRYEHESDNFHPIPRRGKKFDDDLANIPSVRSSIDEIGNNVRIFSNSELGDDRVIIKLDKEMPEISISVKSISIDNNDTILMPNAGNGALGLVLAIKNPNGKFFLYERDSKKKSLIQKNINSSFDFPKDIQLLSELGLSGINNESVDKIIFDGLRLNSSSSKSLFTNDIIFYQKFLKTGGNFYLISKTSCGADSHSKILETVFGQKPEIVGRGNGGYKIFKATKGNESIQQYIETRQTISFDIKGKSFNFETEDALFSKKDLDQGTRFLLETIKIDSFRSLLDFGCGWGPIGIISSVFNPEGNVVMVDNNPRAIQTADTNIKKMGLSERITTITTDSIRDNVKNEFDLVLSNPPFHTKTNELIGIFKQIKEKMKKGASIYLVVENAYKNKFEDVLINSFGSYKLENSNGSYWIISSQK